MQIRNKRMKLHLQDLLPHWSMKGQRRSDAARSLLESGRIRRPRLHRSCPPVVATSARCTSVHWTKKKKKENRDTLVKRLYSHRSGQTFFFSRQQKKTCEFCVIISEYKQVKTLRLSFNIFPLNPTEKGNISEKRRKFPHKLPLSTENRIERICWNW